MTKLTLLFSAFFRFDDYQCKERRGKSYYQSCKSSMGKGTYARTLLGSQYRHPSLLLICSSVIDPHPQGEEVDELRAAQDGESHEESYDATTCGLNLKRP